MDVYTVVILFPLQKSGTFKMYCTFNMIFTFYFEVLCHIELEIKVFSQLPGHSAHDNIIAGDFQCCGLDFFPCLLSNDFKKN